MANYTTNYNLKKPLSSENYDVADQNSNMDIIDTQLKANADAVSGLPKNKLDATTDPGVSNDTTQGYSPGSLWVNVTGKRAYVCTDATAAAAVWEIYTGLGSHLLKNASQAHTMTINEQTGTTYTLVLLDNGRLVDFNNANPITLTIPTNATVEFPIGTQILLRQKGVGQVTITPAVGVTLNTIVSEDKTRVQYSVAGLIKITTDTWSLFGDLEA